MDGKGGLLSEEDQMQNGGSFLSVLLDTRLSFIVPLLPLRFCPPFIFFLGSNREGMSLLCLPPICHCLLS